MKIRKKNTTDPQQTLQKCFKLHKDMLRKLYAYLLKIFYTRKPYAELLNISMIYRRSLKIFGKYHKNARGLSLPSSFKVDLLNILCNYPINYS